MTRLWAPALGKSVLLALVVGMTVLAVTPASGHHSDAGYDEQTVVTFQGTVTRYLWRNPHITPTATPSPFRRVTCIPR